MTITIRPDPAACPAAALSDHPRRHEIMCCRCSPLGDRLLDAATIVGEYGGGWEYYLAWNLAIASLLSCARRTPIMRTYDAGSVSFTWRGVTLGGAVEGPFIELDVGWRDPASGAGVVATDCRLLEVRAPAVPSLEWKFDVADLEVPAAPHVEECNCDAIVTAMGASALDDLVEGHEGDCVATNAILARLGEMQAGRETAECVVLDERDARIEILEARIKELEECLSL